MNHERPSHLRPAVTNEAVRPRPSTPEGQIYSTIVRARGLVAHHQIPVERKPEPGMFRERYWVPEQYNPGTAGYVALCGIQERIPEPTDESTGQSPGYRLSAQFYELYVRDDQHQETTHYRFQPATDHPVQQWNGMELVNIDPVTNPAQWSAMEQAFDALEQGLAAS